MKRIAIAVVSIVALIAILVAAMPFVIPGDFLRGLVATQIAGWTGRTVTVTGEPRLSIYPELAISVDGLTVSNPDELSEESFIAAEGVTASFRVAPLLIGRVVFEEFELIRPRFRLIVSKDGTTNWRMGNSVITAYAESMRERAAAQPAEAVSGNVVTPLLPEPAVGRLRIIDGIILYDDLASDHREEMDAVEIEATWPGASGPAIVRGSVRWRGEPIRFNGSIANPLALMSDGTSPVRFAAASTIARAQFAGEAAATDGALTLTGEASAMTPSLRRAIEWSGTPMGQSAILGAASVQGRATLQDWTVSFTDAAIDLDGNHGRGDLALTVGERPAVRGAITTQRLDLTAYLEAARADLTAESSWLFRPTQLSFADFIDAEIDIVAGEVLAGPAVLQSVEAAFTMRDGALTVDMAQSTLHEGKLTARLGAGMVGDQLVAGLEADISGAKATPLLDELAGISAVDGTANATLSISSRGTTWGEFARTVGGTSTMKVTGGSIEGIDVLAISRALDDPDAEPVSSLSGSTRISSLSATVGIGGGAVATDDLRMTGPGYAMELSGKGSFMTGIVEGNADIVRPSNRIAVTISGRWREPVFAREPAATTAPEQANTEPPSAMPATGG